MLYFIPPIETIALTISGDLIHQKLDCHRNLLRRERKRNESRMQHNFKVISGNIRDCVMPLASVHGPSPHQTPLCRD
jgi:hypothetical protein